MADLLMNAGAVAAGALIGAPARHALTLFVERHAGATFPWGTLAVNVSGALAIGVLAAYAEAHGLTNTAPLWLLLATGVLGSYTTVSSFTLQTLALKARSATAYVALSFVLCLAAIALGFSLENAFA